MSSYSASVLTLKLKTLILLEKIKFKLRICQPFYELSQNKALSVWTPLVGNYFKFQVETFDSL